MPPILHVEGLTKRFGGLRAVDGCSLTVDAGTDLGPATGGLRMWTYDARRRPS
jgi:hypothetical protein